MYVYPTSKNVFHENSLVKIHKATNNQSNYYLLVNYFTLIITNAEMHQKNKVDAVLLLKNQTPSCMQYSVPQYYYVVNDNALLMISYFVLMNYDVIL